MNPTSRKETVVSTPNHTWELPPAKPTLADQAIAYLACASFGGFIGVLAWLIDWSSM